MQKNHPKTNFEPFARLPECKHIPGLKKLNQKYQSRRDDIIIEIKGNPVKP